MEKIVVYAPKYLDDKCVQLMDIYYNGVGVIRELPPRRNGRGFPRAYSEEGTSERKDDIAKLYRLRESII